MNHIKCTEEIKIGIEPSGTRPKVVSQTRVH